MYSSRYCLITAIYLYSSPPLTKLYTIKKAHTFIFNLHLCILLFDCKYSLLYLYPITSNRLFQQLPIKKGKDYYACPKHNNLFSFSLAHFVISRCKFSHIFFASSTLAAILLSISVTVFDSSLNTFSSTI